MWLVIQRQRGRPSGLGASFALRRWWRCRFDSQCGHFRLLCTFFFCLVSFFVHIFSLWHVSLYSHCWPFTASRYFCDNEILVYVVTGVPARSPGSVFRYPFPHVFWKFVPRSRHVAIYCAGHFFGTFSNLEHYFKFPAMLSTFLTFEQNVSVFPPFGQHLSTFFYNFPHVKCNILSFGKLSYSFITNLNNSTLSPDCFHENVILLTVGTVDFGNKYWRFTSSLVTH